MLLWHRLVADAYSSDTIPRSDRSCFASAQILMSTSSVHVSVWLRLLVVTSTPQRHTLLRSSQFLLVEHMPLDRFFPLADTRLPYRHITRRCQPSSTHVLMRLCMSACLGIAIVYWLHSDCWTHPSSSRRHRCSQVRSVGKKMASDHALLLCVTDHALLLCVTIGV